MKVYLRIVAIALIIGGCGQSEEKKVQEPVKEEPVKLEMELPETLFKLKDQKITLRVHDLDFEDGFTAIDSVRSKKLLGTIPPFDKTPIDEAYFVSYQNKVGNVRPIIVYGSTNNYAALLLLNLNEVNKVVSSKEIAGGFCGGPVQHEDRIQWCDDKFTTIVSDSTLVLNHIHLHSPSQERIHEKFIDSVKYLFRINPSGNLDELKKDSTRYYKLESK